MKLCFHDHQSEVSADAVRAGPAGPDDTGEELESNLVQLGKGE